MDEKDLNGFVDVDHDLIKASAAAAEQKASSDVDAISQLLTNQFSDITKHHDEEEAKLEHVVLQEPDSTTTEVEEKIEHLDTQIASIISKITEQEKQQVVAEPVVVTPKPETKPETKPAVVTPAATTTTTTTSGCSYCAWCERLVELIYFHPKVDDVLTWKDPKLSGALFASTLVALITLATVSLLSIVGFLLLASLSLVGGYRLYLFVLGKIKGQSDDTINKYLNMKLSLPNEELQRVVKLVETHGNEYLNKLKQIVLWENPTRSAIALLVAYVTCQIGCAFNTLTLLILLLVFAFTWPKVYRMYKVQIDQFAKTVHDQSLDLLNKVKEKVPFLNKKKLQ